MSPCDLGGDGKAFLNNTSFQTPLCCRVDMMGLCGVIYI